MDERDLINKARQQLTEGNTSQAVETVSGIARSENASPEGLCETAAVFQQAGLAASDVTGLLQRALGIDPRHEASSVSLVECLLAAERLADAVEEIDRFTVLTSSGCHEEVARRIHGILDRFPDARKADEDGGGLGLESRDARGLKPRFNKMRNPIDHLKGLEGKQRNIRSKGHDGAIDSTKKSEQDMTNEFGRIKQASDVHDSPITFSREGEGKGESDQ